MIKRELVKIETSHDDSYILTFRIKRSLLSAMLWGRTGEEKYIGGISNWMDYYTWDRLGLSRILKINQELFRAQALGFIQWLRPGDLPKGEVVWKEEP